MKISVIISSYNDFNGIKRLIESISKQKTSHLVEIIVADDGSDDNIKEFLTSINYPRLKLVTQKHEYFRVARSRNNGVYFSSGDLLVFLDCDIEIINEDFLQQYVDNANHKRVMVSEIIFPASCRVLKLAIPIALIFGIGDICKVASTTIPKVPSDPTISFVS